jgi:hypothetical protein
MIAHNLDKRPIILLDKKWALLRIAHEGMRD